MLKVSGGTSSAFIVKTSDDFKYKVSLATETSVIEFGGLGTSSRRCPWSEAALSRIVGGLNVGLGEKDGS